MSYFLKFVFVCIRFDYKRSFSRGQNDETKFFRCGLLHPVERADHTLHYVLSSRRVFSHFVRLRRRGEFALFAKEFRSAIHDTDHLSRASLTAEQIPYI